jgi:hypothetical protein
MNYFFGKGTSRHARNGGSGLVAGSLTWQVERLRCGESLLKDDASDAMRRACRKAIDAIMGREPQRNYVLSTWYAVHHTGEGETFRLLKLKRVA